LDRFVDRFGMAAAYADGFDYYYKALVMRVVQTELWRVVVRVCYLVVVY